MAETKLNCDYALRVLGVGALMIGMCVWSLYDGLVGWPRQNRDLEQLRPALLATNLTAEAWLARAEEGGSPIQESFAGKGLKLPSKLIKKLGELRVPDTAADRETLRAAQVVRVKKVFESPVYSAHDLQTQFVQAAVTLVLGLCAFCVVGFKARKHYRADAIGLSGSGVGRRTITYAEIAKIDWSKWDEKGIATLTLTSGARHTLDGWHFAGMSGILDEICQRRPDLCPEKK